MEQTIFTNLKKKKKKQTINLDILIFSKKNLNIEVSHVKTKFIESMVYYMIT